jgi:hypothetical protein
MSNYKYNNTDLDTLCEPYAATGLSTCNTCPFQSAYYNNMGGYASYDSGYGYMTLAFPADIYKQAGANVSVSALGYRPRNTFRFEFTTAGTYYITRSDSEITTWNSSGSAIGHYAASIFGLSKAPYILIFYLAGGGGGGGGGSGTVSSGGGGGAGIALGWVKIPTSSTYTDGVTIVIGGGGAGGAGGTGTNAKRGSTGVASTLSCQGGGLVACNPGTGGANASPTNGSGGTCSINPLAGYLGIFATINGGDGGTNGGDSGDGRTISGTVAPDFSYSNTANGGAAPTSQGGGGASYGIGGQGVASGSGWDGEKGGGGGGGVYTIFDGKNGGNGGTGIARFYY